MSDADFDRLLEGVAGKMRARREVIQQAEGEIKIRIFKRVGGFDVKIDTTL